MQSNEEDTNIKGNKKSERKPDDENKNFIPVFDKVSSEIDDIILNGKSNKNSEDSFKNEQIHDKKINDENTNEPTFHEKESFNSPIQKNDIENHSENYDDKKEEIFEIAQFNEVGTPDEKENNSFQQNESKIDNKSIDESLNADENKKNMFFNNEKKKKTKIKFNKKVDKKQKKSFFDTSFFSRKSEDKKYSKDNSDIASSTTASLPQTQSQPSIDNELQSENSKTIEEKTEPEKKPLLKKEKQETQKKFFTKKEKTDTEKKPLFNKDKSEKKSFSLFKKEDKKELKESNEPDSKQKPQTNDGYSKDKEETVHIYQNNEQTTDEELIKFLKLTDDLLGKLPEHVISEFASSEDFTLYQKIMEKYKVK